MNGKKAAGSLKLPAVHLLHILLVGLDHLLDHLAADGAGFAAGQVAVVALLQVNADFGCGCHFELVHGLPGFGNVQLVVVILTLFSALLWNSESKVLSEESIFFFP